MRSARIFGFLFAFLLALTINNVSSERAPCTSQLLSNGRISMGPRGSSVIRIQVLNRSSTAIKAILLVDATGVQEVLVGCAPGELSSAETSRVFELAAGSHVDLEVRVEATGGFSRRQPNAGGTITMSVHDYENRNRELTDLHLNVHVEPAEVPQRLKVSALRQDKQNEEYRPGDFISLAVTLTKVRSQDVGLPIPYAIELVGGTEIAATFHDAATGRAQEIQGVIAAGKKDEPIVFRGRIPSGRLGHGVHQIYHGFLNVRDLEGEVNPEAYAFNIAVAGEEPRLCLEMNSNRLLIVQREQLILEGHVKNTGASTMHLNLRSRVEACGGITAAIAAPVGPPVPELPITLAPGQDVPFRVLVNGLPELRMTDVVEGRADDEGTRIVVTVADAGGTVEERNIRIRYDASREVRASGGNLAFSQSGTRVPARLAVQLQAYRNRPGPVEGVMDLIGGPARQIDVGPGEDIWIRFQIQNEGTSNWVFLKGRTSNIDQLLVMEEPPVLEKDPFGDLTSPQDRAAARADELNRSMMMIGMIPAGRVSGFDLNIPRQFLRPIELGMARGGLDVLAGGVSSSVEEYMHLEYSAYLGSLNAASKVPALFPPGSQYQFLVHYKVPPWLEPGRHDLRLMVRYLDTRRNSSQAENLLTSRGNAYREYIAAGHTLRAILDTYRRRVDDRGDVFSESADEMTSSEVEGNLVLAVTGRSVTARPLTEIDELLAAGDWRHARQKAENLARESRDAGVKGSAQLRVGRSYLEDATEEQNLVKAKARLEAFLAGNLGHAEANEGRFYLGVTLQRLGEFEEALHVYATVRDDVGGDPGLVFRARQNADWLQRTAASSAQRLIENGKDLLQRKQYYDAANKFEMVRLNYPQSPRLAEALFYRGRCFEEAGDGPEAEKLYTEVVNRFPGVSWATSASMKLRQLAAQHSSGDLLLQEGDAALARGDNLTAAMRFHAWLGAHAAESARPTVLMKYAGALAGQGKFVEARQVYEEMLLRYPLSPETAKARMGIAAACRLQGDFAAAEKAYDAVIVLNSGTAEAREAGIRLEEIRRTLSSRSLAGLEVASLQLRDFGDDGRSLNNNVLEAGEAGVVAVSIRNRSSRRLENLTVTPMSDANSTMVVDPTPRVIDSVEAGAAISLTSPIAVRAAPGTTAGRAFLRMKVRDASGGEVVIGSAVALAAALPPAPSSAPGPQKHWFVQLLQAGVQAYARVQASNTYMETGRDPTGGEIDRYYRLMNGGVGRAQEIQNERAQNEQIRRENARVAASAAQPPSASTAPAASPSSSVNVSPSPDGTLIARLLTPIPVVIERSSEQPVFIEIELSTSGENDFKGQYHLFPSEIWGNGSNNNLHYAVSRGQPRVIRENLFGMFGRTMPANFIATVQFRDDGGTVKDVNIPVNVTGPEASSNNEMDWGRLEVRDVKYSPSPLPTTGVFRFHFEMTVYANGKPLENGRIVKYPNDYKNIYAPSAAWELQYAGNGKYVLDYERAHASDDHAGGIFHEYCIINWPTNRGPTRRPFIIRLIDGIGTNRVEGGERVVVP